MKLIMSKSTKGTRGFQFAIRSSGHTTQLVYSDNLSFLMPYSSELDYGLILPSGQELPIDLSLTNISFLVILPSEVGVSELQSSPQSKQTLVSISDRCFPNLKYLLLKDVLIANAEEMSTFIQRSKVEVYNL